MNIKHMYTVPEQLPVTSNRQSTWCRVQSYKSSNTSGSTSGVISKSNQQRVPWGRARWNHVYPVVGHSKTIFDFEMPQYMRHNAKRPSQAAGDNPAGRTRNRIKATRVQDTDELDISKPSQTEKPGPSRIGPPVQIPIPAPTLATASALTRHAVAVPATV